ncbi:hypothetical protein PG997_007887 [Apiospora hydei]|uniref:ATPase AAA-type core domain-containing protein n=1 Tax=Apiospora hydei TaxID=1337664 RepID=A0ABR1W994_9PEZI
MFPLAPPTVFAFDLRAHKWRQIYIDPIQMIAWNTSAVKGLMRDIEEEEILRSICRPSTRRSSTVVLFHGPPGNGKTVAAEAVAEFAKRPLFSIAPHELGSTVKDFQDFINPTLILTRSWDCVLLLEQFDIYLESRATNDVTRDWIVAEFKRLRDNFQGIITLTTSRIDMFDAAFKSRLDIIFHFPKLDMRKRQMLCKRFFDRMDKPPRDCDNIIRGISEYQFNGRQIRSLIENARLLAIFRNQPLEQKHVEAIINRMIEPDRDLADARIDSEKEPKKKTVG